MPFSGPAGADALTTDEAHAIEPDVIDLPLTLTLLSHFIARPEQNRESRFLSHDFAVLPQYSTTHLGSSKYRYLPRVSVDRFLPKDYRIAII